MSPRHFPHLSLLFKWLYPGEGRRFRITRLFWRWLGFGGFVCYFLPAIATVPTIGLPITRHYSIEEIGVNRGPRLSFDRFGRLAVIGGGSYIVLNDGAWLQLLTQDPDSPILLDVMNAPDGKTYYGALASWGTAEYTAVGRIEARSMRPADYPKWINATNFTRVISLGSALLFSGHNGVVFLDTADGSLHFHEIPGVATTFTLNGEVFISRVGQGTQRLDPRTGTMETIDANRTVHRTAALQNGRIIGASINGELLYFDGQSFTDSGIRFGKERTVDISALEALPDGGFAVAADAEGLYLFSDDSQCRMALTNSGYRRIYDFACEEPGVLWVATERSIEKIFYNDPVSVIDQRSDVVVSWPQVVQWGDQTVAATSGRIYDIVVSEDGRNQEFREVSNPDIPSAWAVAANTKHFVLGNNGGLFFRTATGFQPIPGLPGANRLFLPEDDLCLVIASDEIAAMRWTDGEWRECAARIPGVGFPSVAVPTDHALWLELGLNRVARIWFADGALHQRIYDDFPWSEAVWINIGTLQDFIVLSGAENQRIFLDKATGERVPVPPIAAALDLFPTTILRVVEDENGIIWGSHRDGVMTLLPDGDGYRLDTDSLGSIHDLYPIVNLFNQRHVWIATESALYHVDQTFAPRRRSARQPFLVSVRDGKTGEELLGAAEPLKGIGSLPYRRNHLEFRYFSGGYHDRTDPVYAFSMQHGSDTWNVPSAGSLLTLPQLEEGNYQLTARLRSGDATIGEPIVTTFTIRPPWYRSTLAYIGYTSAALLASLALAGWAVGGAKRKRDALERLVQERTDELRTTMDKLTDEARTSATLAERNRLAGEIHDSLQQGLSGLALHLDSTIKKIPIDSALHDRLAVARRMVSYTRQEVQHAVWDLESPLLQNDSLPHALRSLVDLIGTESMQVEVATIGEEAPLSSTTKHHLLRIAQEAVTNAIRHSGAEQVWVNLEFSDRGTFLAIRDDGRGFVPDDVLTGGIGHFGLRGLRSRAQKVRGDLRIESTPGRGTIVSIRVPVASSS